MTYTATRYARSPQGTHPCPDSYRGYPHNLVPYPGGRPDEWVCPHALGQEISEAYKANREAAVIEMRRADAERLAREGMAQYEADLYDGKSPSIRETIVAAALAMAELEAVR
jgi:hypothetical protein